MFDELFNVSLEMRVGAAGREYEFERATISDKGGFIIVECDGKESWFQKGLVVYVKKSPATKEQK